MAVTKEELIREYTRAIQEGNAAIFAGAGLSRPSGFVDWKGLLLHRILNLILTKNMICCRLPSTIEIKEELDLVLIKQLWMLFQKM